MDQYAHAVAEYLKGHVGVQDVKYVPGEPASMSDIQAWEDANAPFKLPDDLKAFLLSSNGMKMTWDVLFKQEVHHLGNMHINSLAEIEMVPMALVPHDDEEDEILLVPPGSVWDPRRDDDGERGPKDWKPPVPSAAFDLDSSIRHGRVALVFVPAFDPSSSGSNVGDELTPTRSVPHKAQVWFQDISTRWHIVADSFGEYYRLMAAHLGLPRWHYKIMDVGMDRPTTQWFNFFKPELLAMDLDKGKLRRQEMKRRY